MGYTQDQATKAEAWILYGDWKYRGVSPTLDITDFFPTPEQVATVQARFDDAVVVVERSRIRAACEQAYRQGHADGIRDERARNIDREGIRDLQNQWEAVKRDDQ